MGICRGEPGQEKQTSPAKRRPADLERAGDRGKINAASVLYTLISRGEKFEKVKPGEYRLVGAQQSLPSIS